MDYSHLRWLIFYNDTMSAIPENSMIDAKLIDPSQFLLKLYIFCVRSWLYDGSQMTATYMYVALNPNKMSHMICALAWPSDGHTVCLMTAILVFRLSKIMFASHSGVGLYMKILQCCYQNHESAYILLTIILIFGFHKWRSSWILPIMQ